jgi:DNA-binding transcriptional regulator YiaG
LIGVSSRAVYSWEKNEETPRFNSVPGLIRFLGYNPFPTPEEFPARVRFVRRLLGQSQREFARLLGVDPKTILGWETGRYAPQRRWRERVEEMLRDAARAASPGDVSIEAQSQDIPDPER